MGIQKKTRKFAQVKRVIGQRDARLKKNQQKAETVAKKKAKSEEIVRHVYHSLSLCNCLILILNRPRVPTNLFFQYNTSLVPPYNVLGIVYIATAHSVGN